MALYFADTEITGVKDLFPLSSKDTTNIYFADTELFTVWDAYDGTLPAQFNANGDNLADYRIYGASGGVGDDSGTAYGYEVDMSVSDGTTSTTTPIFIGSDPLGEDEYVDYKEQKVYRRTEQLFNKNSEDIIFGIRLSTDGAERPDELDAVSAYISVEVGETYTMKNVLNAGTRRCIQYDENKNVISIISNTFTVLAGVAYIRVTFAISEINNVMVTKGSTAPAQYIPYLQPEDPPVPLPALPTVDGTTIVDYAGQSAAVPEKVDLKYRKEGFK